MNYKSVIGKGTATGIMTLSFCWLIPSVVDYWVMFIFFNFSFVFAMYYAKENWGLITYLTKWGDEPITKGKEV